MPKIHLLPPLTDDPADDDVLAMDDASVADATSPTKTKKISLAQLRAWLQSLAGWITTAMIGDGQVNSSKVDWASATGKIWWEEIGRTTLTSSTSSITVNSLPARANLKLMIRVTEVSASTTISIRVNNDSGNNYVWQRSTSGVADPAATTATNAIQINTTSAPGFYIFDIRNGTPHEKMFIGHTIRGTAGAGATTARDEIIGKWANTSVPISSISVITSGATYAAGSEVIVLGHD